MNVMFKLKKRVIVMVWCFILSSISSNYTLAENLDVQVFKSNENNSGYVEIGLDALRALEVASAYFKKSKKNIRQFDSLFYTVEGEKILITFLGPPLELDGDLEFKVVLDRKSLKIMSVQAP
jgi:hypothetical protein